MLGYFALFGLVALSGFTPALAIGKPLFLDFHEESTDVFADCGAFQVLDAFQGDVKLTAMFDETGNVDMIIVDFHGTDTFINSITDKSFTERFHNKVLHDFEKDRLAEVGVFYHLTVPGEGAVLLDIGRIVIDPPNIAFEAGPHQYFDGDFAGLCAALA
jgi:hypothetical protein